MPNFTAPSFNDIAFTIINKIHFHGFERRKNYFCQSFPVVPPHTTVYRQPQIILTIATQHRLVSSGCISSPRKSNQSLRLVYTYTTPTPASPYSDPPMQLSSLLYARARIMTHSRTTWLQHTRRPLQITRTIGIFFPSPLPLYSNLTNILRKARPRRTFASSRRRRCRGRRPG